MHFPLCINLGRYFPGSQTQNGQTLCRGCSEYSEICAKETCFSLFLSLTPIAPQSACAPPPPTPPHLPPLLPQQAGLTGCPSIEMPAAFTCHPQFSILHEETARLENNGPFPSSYFKLRGRKKDLVFITHKPDLRIKVITVQM